VCVSGFCDEILIILKSSADLKIFYINEHARPGLLLIYTKNLHYNKENPSYVLTEKRALGYIEPL